MLAFGKNAVAFEVVKTNKVSADEKTYFYALPKHKLKVKIVVKKTDFVKGVFSEYAEEMIEINNAVKENKSVFQIEDIDYASEIVVDEEEIFAVYADKKEKLSIRYAKELIPAAISIAPMAKPAALLSENPQILTEKPFSIVKIYNKVENSFNKTLYSSKNNKKDEATKLLARLKEIEENRKNLLTSFYEIAYDGSAISAILSQFDSEKTEILKLFTGYVNENYEEFYYDFVPQRETTIFEFARFSDNSGLLGVDDYGQILRLTFELPDSYLSSQSAVNHGFAYKSLQNVKMYILLGDKEIFATDVLLSQFCTTLFAPKEYGSYYFGTGGNLLKFE
ncbi:hypothetical protein FACS1894178_1040 [Bacteroidia bacterium]|nr:hypothetical protein FACS1894178_1040 [Bacteroidia bacterium]